MAERSSFSGKLAVILVAAGATIGLGCLWRFPYLTAEYGGGLFILLFMILLFLFGVPLLLTEFAIGRKTANGALSAYKKLHPKFAFLGWLTIIGLLLNEGYYIVLTGWIGKYTLLYVTGNSAEVLTPGYYSSFSAGFEPIHWVVIIAVLMAICCLLGLRKGVERFTKFLLPVAVILLIIFSIFVFTIPNTLEGINYYLMPNFSTFSGETILAALGQVFFSLSVGLGIMLTIGSYTSKKDNLVQTTGYSAIFVAIISFVAGLTVVPISFMVTGGDPASFGTGLVCESLPLLFSQIAGGEIFGAVFFVLLFIACLLANIFVLETLVTAFIDQFHISRPKGVFILSILVVALGIIVSLGFGALEWVNVSGDNLMVICDTLSGTIILPLVAFFTCILVGFFTKPSVIFDEITIGAKPWVQKFRKPFSVMIRYVVPACILIIFIYGIIDLI